MCLILKIIKQSPNKLNFAFEFNFEILINVLEDKKQFDNTAKETILDIINHKSHKVCLFVVYSNIQTCTFDNNPNGNLITRPDTYYLTKLGFS